MPAAARSVEVVPMEAGNQRAQEVFEFVSKHLFEQGVQAGDGVKCYYRGPNGTKCAVGCLIPDELYEPRMDGRFSAWLESNLDVFELAEQYPGVISNTGVSIGLLRDLQFCHDMEQHWITSSAMRESLRFVGNDFTLNVEFLDELSFKDR